jgi:26S proteasome regulatory subunit N1
MGKGMTGLNPFFSDQSIMSRPAVTGLLAMLTAFTDVKHCECSRSFLLLS